MRIIVLQGSIILLSIVLLFMILLSIILLGHLLLWRILGIVAGVLHATIAHRYIVPETNSTVLTCTLGLMLVVTEVPFEPSHLKSFNFLSTQLNKHLPVIKVMQVLHSTTNRLKLLIEFSSLP